MEKKEEFSELKLRTRRWPRQQECKKKPEASAQAFRRSNCQSSERIAAAPSVKGKEVMFVKNARREGYISLMKRRD